MTLSEAGKRLGKSEYTVRRYVKQGKIEATLVSGKYDITEEALYDYMDTYADGQDELADGELARKEQEIRFLRNQLEQMSSQVLKLQDEMIESQRRSDTIVAQLTAQATKQTQLLEYHNTPWWRRVIQRRVDYSTGEAVNV